MDILYQASLELRRALDDITESFPADEQIARVTALCTVQTHSIKVASDPQLGGVPLDKFTCFMHTFDLIDSTAVTEIARTFKETYPNSDFVAYLVSRYLSELPQKDAHDCDVVIYSNDNEITHAGKLKGGRVVSKWGTGYLWEHDLSEVPAKYGHVIKFYRAIPPVVADEAFVAYARQRQGTETIDLLLGK